MANNYIFSSESVTEGHPDKVCDTISDAVLDACLSQDTTSRVACETMVKDNAVILGGEITTASKFDYNEVVKTPSSTSTTTRNTPRAPTTPTPASSTPRTSSS